MEIKKVNFYSILGKTFVEINSQSFRHASRVHFAKIYFGIILKFVRNSNFGQNSEIWPKFWNLAEILKFGRNSEIWPKVWNLADILKLGRNSEICPKFGNLAAIQKCVRNSEICPKFVWKAQFSYFNDFHIFVSFQFPIPISAQSIPIVFTQSIKFYRQPFANSF